MDVYTSRIREGLAKERSPTSALGKIMLAQCGSSIGRGQGEGRRERRKSLQQTRCTDESRSLDSARAEVGETAGSVAGSGGQTPFENEL